MRIVLDTNVLVRSTPASAGGPAHELFQRILTSHTLLISAPLLLEFSDVVMRPKLRAALGLTEHDAAQFIDQFTDVIQKLAEVVILPASTPAYVPNDPKDAALVQTAFLGDAHVICTLDRHLSHPQVLSLCHTREIRVLSDIDLLNELRAGDQP